MSIKRWLAAAIAFILVFLHAFTAFADENILPDETEAVTENSTESVSENTYRSYKASLPDEKNVYSLVLPLGTENTDYTGAEIADNVNGRDRVLNISGGGSAEVTANVEKSGLYYISLAYLPLDDKDIGFIKIGLEIDNKALFDAMENISLSGEWIYDGGIKSDSRGNQILPSQKNAGQWIERPINDPEGRYNEPLMFYFDQGEHKIKLNVQRGKLALSEINIYYNGSLPSYSEYKNKNSDKTDTADVVKYVEAEGFISKSDSTILPDFDKSDAATQPNDASKLVFNYISGNRFSKPGQWVKWKLTVPENGLYNISMRVRQSIKSGFSSNRRFTIDGECVFDGMDILTFESNDSWYRKTLGNENENYLFYFEKDREYELCLEVVPGPLSDVTLMLDDGIYLLNSLYHSIVMVAGTNPDKYRDYNLKGEIPDIDKKIDDVLSLLKKQEQAILKVNAGRSGSELTAIKSIINRLKKAKSDADFLARSLGNLKSEIEALSAWNMDTKNQPLDIDYIAVHSPGAELSKERQGFFQGLWFGFKRLLASYSTDYGTVGEIYNSNDSISVWLTLGRDQLDVFKKLTDNEFIPKYNTRVNVSLVPTGIREAVLAGKAPDAALFLSSDEPFNLAVRSALVDLSKEENFNEVKNRFTHDAMESFAYDGGYYALPLTEVFPMMFVRTDIFDELGLKTPQTWDDMLSTAAVLHRKNMEIGIPSSMGMFATFLFQNGGSFYSDDFKKTAFDREEAVDAFKTWSGFFSQYGFPLTYDLYNRFRSGEMPIGIAPYSVCTMLETAAPEISGRWQMLPLPGVMRDGEIDRSVSISNADGSGTNPGLNQGIASAVIFKNSKKREEAWKLLEWFTSDDVQTSYGLSVEASLGAIARYTPANIEVLKRLPWEKEQTVLLEQWNRVKIIPEIPGSYYIARGVNNAFRRVIYENDSPVDTLNRYNIQINKEIARKWEEVSR